MAINDKYIRNTTLTVVIVVVLVGVLWFVKMDRPVSESPSATPLNMIESFEGKIPDQFPTEIPIETGAKIVSSYRATSPTGRIQLTVVFESSKTILNNAKLYNDYLPKNGWKIINQTTKPGQSLIVATNNLDIINISIYRAKDLPSLSLVDLSFVTK